MIVQLRPYQEEAVDSLFHYFSENDGNPVIAMPTGTGKSLVIAGFIQRAMEHYPDQRFLMLTHVKELIEQNADKLTRFWPQAPVGMYSAGLKRRDTMMPIIFGGSGSVINKIQLFGHRDLLIIDECHLLSPKADTTYQKIIAFLQEINPYLKVIGLSATPYRLGQGMITDDGIFTDICCDQTGIDAFNQFITDGYLAPLIPKRTATELDVSEVGMSGGEFVNKALQAAVNKQEVTHQALIELCEMAADRRSWLIFASGTEHADNIAAMLNQFGVSADSVHSKKPAKERDKSIEKFKAGKLRAIVNNNVLTTGFDHPPVDCIAMLRPTMSPGLWVQMLGRGTRPSPETHKENCLVLDFAGNTRRLGPINDPVIPRRKGAGGGEAPVKVCDECGTYNHAAVRHCFSCGHEFEFQTKIVTEASSDELIKSDLPVIDWFDVQQVNYSLHEKMGTPPSIRVTYMCSNAGRMFDEWVCIEHDGFAGKKARDWWRKRFPGDYVPHTTSEALSCITQLSVPNRIKVWINKKYPEVMEYDYTQRVDPKYDGEFQPGGGAAYG